MLFEKLNAKGTKTDNPAQGQAVHNLDLARFPHHTQQGEFYEEE